MLYHLLGLFFIVSYRHIVYRREYSYIEGWLVVAAILRFALVVSLVHTYLFWQTSSSFLLISRLFFTSVPYTHQGTYPSR